MTEKESSKNTQSDQTENEEKISESQNKDKPKNPTLPIAIQKAEKIPASLIRDIACHYANFFHSPEKGVFAEIQNENLREVFPVKSEQCKRWLSHKVYRLTEKIPMKNKLEEAILQLEGEAIYDGPEHKVYSRYAEEAGGIYIDTANEKGEQIVINEEGCKTILSTKSPIRFLRRQGMLPLPELIEEEGDIEMLKKYINLRNEDEFVLVLSWIAAAMNPNGPYPILIIQAEQGAGKSTMARFLRDLIDPSSMPVRSSPRSERDLVISASNAWVVAFDNISSIDDNLSDALCRLTTGGGFATRKLWTDDVETQFNLTRPVIINGIPDDMVSRQDLADRSLTVHLTPIKDEERKTEEKLKEGWEKDRSLILKGLYQAISAGLKNRGKVKLKSLPRMADFAMWASEVETGLPWEDGTFKKAYDKSREELIEDAIEADEVAAALVEFMKYESAWEGTASALLKILSRIIQEWGSKPNDWPKQPNQLSNRLTRAVSFLRRQGIAIEKLKKFGERIITLRKSKLKTAPPPPPSSGTKQG